jgi:hypothetical protein
MEKFILMSSFPEDRILSSLLITAKDDFSKEDRNYSLTPHTTVVTKLCHLHEKQGTPYPLTVCVQVFDIIFTI